MKDAADLWVILIGLVVAAVAAIVKTVRSLRRLARMVDEFLGYEGHPGIADRVTTLEHDMTALREEIQELKRLVSVQTPAAVVNVTPPPATTTD